MADIRSYNTHTFEGYLSEITRSLLPGKISKDTDKPLPEPYAGYNNSRHLFGGVRGTYNSTASTIGFNKLDFDVSGSGSSADIDVGFVGERNPKSGIFKNLQWRVGYRYSNLPGTDVELAESTGLAQFNGGTRPLGKLGLIFRFGSSFEFGNSQSDPSITPPAGIVSQTAYGSLKSFIGVTSNQGNSTWRVSYGLTLGQTGKEFSVDYVKHVFDAVYKADFLLRPHFPFQVDAQFSAGAIQSNNGDIPPTERFFGGNAQTEYIQGMDWQINASPYIRSFPQNSFSLNSIGGTKFVSANLTLAQTIWSKPAVPDEIGTDPEARIKLRGQIMSASIATKYSYLSDTRQFKSMLEKISASPSPSDSSDDIATAVRKTGGVLATIKATEPPDPIPDIIAEIEPVITEALEQIAEIRKAPDIGSVRSLVTGFGDVSPSIIGKMINGSEDEDTRGLKQLVQEIENVTNNDPARKAALDGPKANLIGLQAKLAEQAKQVGDELEAVKRLGAISADDLSSAKNKLPTLDNLLNDVSTELDQINEQLGNSTPPPPPERLAITNASGLYTQVSLGALSRARNPDTDVSYAALKMLVEDTGKVTPAALTGLSNSLDVLSVNLRALGMGTHADVIASKVSGLRQVRALIRADLTKVKIPEVERLARRDIAFTGRTLDTIFRRLNLISFAPVAMMDVAWLGPKTPAGFGGTRYGIGPGGRFSLVSVDLTVGYSFNPKPRLGERRGAVVFSLDIRDLFR
jgi:hypothetical protein